MMSIDLISSTPDVKVSCEIRTSCCDTEISRGPLISPKGIYKKYIHF